MKNFLALFGMSDDYISPFCRNFKDEKELCEVFKKFITKENNLQ